MNKKKKIKWTEEDQKALEKLQEKKKLWERGQNIDAAAEQLFALGSFLKKAGLDGGLGIKFDVYYDPGKHNKIFKITIPNDIMREINDAK